MDHQLRQQLEAHHTVSYRWALTCSRGDALEAEEILQTVYLKVLEGKARFGGASSFTTWLYAVIRRTAAEGRRRRFFQALWLTRAAPELRDRAGPDDTEQGYAAPLIQRAVEALATRQREVITLVFYHELTVEQAAGVMGIGVGSARTHYARGKQRLRILLADLGGTDG